jgi:Tfp pilus assembly protein PilF
MGRTAVVFLSLWVTHAVPDQKQAQAHQTKGRQLMNKGDDGAAETELRKAVALDPTWAEPLYDLASVQAMADKNSESAATYRTFIARFPGDRRVPMIREALKAYAATAGATSPFTPTKRRPRKN